MRWREQRPFRMDALRYLLAYLLWFASIGLGVLGFLAIRDTLRYLMIVTQLHRYTIHAVSQLVTIAVAFVVVILIVFLEHYYRTGVTQNRLLLRFARMTAFGLLLLCVAHVIYVLVAWSDGLFARYRLALAIVELLAGLALIMLSRRRLRQDDSYHRA